MKRFYPYRGDAVTLATTVAFGTVRGKPPWANAVAIEAPSATAEIITVAFVPKIQHVFIYDASLAAAARWQDFTKALTDRNTSTDSRNALNEFQTGDRIYVGCRRQFRGLAIDVVNTNSAGTATMVPEYPTQPTGVWTDLSITDGTFSTRTLAQDGLATWTVPTAGWKKGTLAALTEGLTEGSPPANVPVTEPLFWARLRVSAALTDTSVSIAEIVALLNTTINGLTPDVEGFDVVRIGSGNKQPYLFPLHEDIGGVELVSTSLTSVAAVNWYSLQDR